MFPASLDVPAGLVTTGPGGVTLLYANGRAFFYPARGRAVRVREADRADRYTSPEVIARAERAAAQEAVGVGAVAARSDPRSDTNAVADTLTPPPLPPAPLPPAASVPIAAERGDQAAGESGSLAFSAFLRGRPAHAAEDAAEDAACPPGEHAASPGAPDSSWSAWVDQDRDQGPEQEDSDVPGPDHHGDDHGDDDAHDDESAYGDEGAVWEDCYSPTAEAHIALAHTAQAPAQPAITVTAGEMVALARALIWPDGAELVTGDGSDMAPVCASSPAPSSARAPSPASPVPDRPSAYGFTPARRVRFAEVLAESGNVRHACAVAGISRHTAYKARRRDAVLAEVWDAALVMAARHAGAVLGERALDGVEEPVFWHGELVGTRQRYDNRLLLAHVARLDALAAQRGPKLAAGRFDELLARLGGMAGDAALCAPLPSDDADDAPIDDRARVPGIALPREEWCAHAVRHAEDVALARAEAEGWDDDLWEARVSDLCTAARAMAEARWDAHHRAAQDWVDALEQAGDGEEGGRAKEGTPTGQ